MALNYHNHIKRGLDILLSAGALLMLWPVLLIVAVLVRHKLGSPVLFCQERPGRHEKIFKLYKFRTMTDQRDADGNLLHDSMRLTKFGKFLRATSLDELPELWNILKGDMSIVGPRPLLVKYLPLYNETQKHRHDVRPGLTGWAQVHGRNSITWEEKFQLDVWYVEHISFWVDVKTILLTVKKVFAHEGISAEGSDTIEAFTGSPEDSV